MVEEKAFDVAATILGAHPTFEQAVAVSLAISLRRIADATEGARPPVHYHLAAGSIVRAVGDSLTIDPSPSPASELVDVGLREAVARAIKELEHDENSRLPVANMLRRASR